MGAITAHGLDAGHRSARLTSLHAVADGAITHHDLRSVYAGHFWLRGRRATRDAPPAPPPRPSSLGARPPRRPRRFTIYTLYGPRLGPSLGTRYSHVCPIPAAADLSDWDDYEISTRGVRLNRSTMAFFAKSSLSLTHCF